MIKVGIVDDHTLFRKGLIMMVNSFEGISVVLEAADGRQFLDSLPDNDIDLVLLDLQMPNMDGYKTCEVLRERHPDIRILIISQQTTRESIHKVMELGAHGYFTKNSDPVQLESAIRSLNDKGFYFGMELGTVLREAILWDAKNPSRQALASHALTEREIEIIRLAACELSSQEIADRLFINARTVETHRKHIMEKTGARNFIGAVLFAVKHNLISVELL